MLSVQEQDVVVRLFNKRLTVNQISEALKVDEKEVLSFLTAQGYWSKYCSGCVIKNCYNCPGLQDLGKPITIQDRIDFIARVKNATIKT